MKYRDVGLGYRKSEGKTKTTKPANWNKGKLFAKNTNFLYSLENLSIFSVEIYRHGKRWAHVRNMKVHLQSTRIQKRFQEPHNIICLSNSSRNGHTRPLLPFCLYITWLQLFKSKNVKTISILLHPSTVEKGYLRVVLIVWALNQVKSTYDNKKIGEFFLEYGFQNLLRIKI